MIKYPDGEFRNDSVKNDYSAESVDSKIKYFILFESESAIVYSLLGMA